MPSAQQAKSLFPVIGADFGCPGIMKKARSEACGYPRTYEFGPEIRISFLPKKVARGRKETVRMLDRHKIGAVRTQRP